MPVVEICTCPECFHPMERHGMGYVDVSDDVVMVVVCMSCPRNACLINIVREVPDGLD